MNTKQIKPTTSQKAILSFIILCVCVCLTACGNRRPKPASSYVPENYLAESALISFDRTLLNTIPNNPYPSLSVPTYITKVEDAYFIVDCYNNQVIYHDNLSAPLYEWLVMTNDISMGHTLASDGLVYLIDDTENNRILVMEKEENGNGQPVFIPTQEFKDIGNRPHYIIYDEYTDTFYAWSSQSGEMFLFRHPENDSRLYLTEVRSIPSLNNIYVRSFTIIEDSIYFVSGTGNSSIIEADLYTFQIKKEYPVPAQMAGMIQLTRIEDYFYITISTDNTGNQDFATMLRAKSLDDLSSGNYEDVYGNFIGGGTPYYITQIDNMWYLTEHRLPGHSVWRFQVKENQITDATTIY
ncbi:MAG: hypothetical protein K2P30_06260 [Lachnospiraceae bacterium]|nr:hypothetical protein [Lachnospiraceae bacterium]